jgi:hypothetical protein
VSSTKVTDWIVLFVIACLIPRFPIQIGAFFWQNPCARGTPNMKATLLSLAILVLIASNQPCAYAQPGRQLSSKVATKVDEYGRVGGCDQTARLDNFAIFLDATPGSTGYVFVYAPEPHARRVLEAIKGYLVDARGISADRITTVYGGRNDVLSQPRVQLWFVPPAARRPKPEKFDSKIETFQGLFVEYNAWDDSLLEVEFEQQGEKMPAFEDAGTGPGVGDVTNASLADVLKVQKTAIAYVVGYNGEDAAPGAWQRVSQNQVSGLKEFGVEASRLKIIFGGTAKETKVQLWMTPANAPAPVADAGPESPPSKRAVVGTFYDNELAYAGVERAAFKRISDALKQFSSLRVCVVVTLSTYQPDPEDAAIESVAATDASASEPETEPEPEPVDVTQLVEKWKNELSEKHKVGADRFIVLFTHSEDFVNNIIEAYALPPGAPLPNPNETDEEETETAPPAPVPPALLVPVNPLPLPKTIHRTSRNPAL